MSVSRALLALVICSCLFVPALAFAQFPIFPIDKIKYVDAYGEIGTLVGGSDLEDRAGSLRGVGFEMILSLGTATVGPLKGYDFDFAVGYEYQSRFKAKEETLDLRGAIQAFPAITLYLSHKDAWKWFTPYVGVSSGLVLLANVRGYDSAQRQFSADGLTYQLGVGAGVVHNSGLLVEVTYNYRDFNSVDWKFGGSGTTLPAAWPKSLNASSLSICVGVQFEKLERK